MSPDLDTGKKGEQKREKINPKDFLFRLYGKITQYLINNGGQVRQEFGPQKIKNWEYCGEFFSEYLPLNLEKAVLIQDPKKDFLLVLGRGKKSRYWQDTLRLQFGFLRHTDKERGLSSIDKLRWLVDQSGLYSGKGEFYIGVLGGMKVSCWADEPEWGGKRLGKYPQSSSEEVLTAKGLEDSLDVVKRIIRICDACDSKDST